jgi:hypothetical protein
MKLKLPHFGDARDEADAVTIGEITLASEL